MTRVDLVRHDAILRRRSVDKGDGRPAAGQSIPAMLLWLSGRLLARMLWLSTRSEPMYASDARGCSLYSARIDLPPPLPAPCDACVMREARDEAARI